MMLCVSVRVARGPAVSESPNLVTEQGRVITSVMTGSLSLALFHAGRRKSNQACYTPPLLFPISLEFKDLSTSRSMKGCPERIETSIYGQPPFTFSTSPNAFRMHVVHDRPVQKAAPLHSEPRLKILQRGTWESLLPCMIL
jgi:hypothetical protein